MLKEKIVTLVDLFWQEAKSKGLELPNPTIRFDLNGRTAGTARPSRNELRFNIPLLSRVSEDEVYQTVGHECVHIFADRKHKRSCGHGRLWKFEMMLYGLEPKRCHDYDTSGLVRKRKLTRRFSLVCPCSKEYIVSKKVAERAHLYKCRQCGRQELKFVGEKNLTNE